MTGSAHFDTPRRLSLVAVSLSIILTAIGLTGFIRVIWSYLFMLIR